MFSALDTGTIPAQAVQQFCPGLVFFAVWAGSISNLLRNALQSLRTQAPDPRRLRVVISRSERWLALHIADSGSGLASSERQDLVMNNDKPGSMSLGLLTAQSIARRHGDELRLGASTELGGAEASLRFPSCQ